MMIMDNDNDKYFMRMLPSLKSGFHGGPQNVHARQNPEGCKMHVPG